MHIDLTSTTARRRAAVALVAGPAVTVAGMAATPWETDRSTAAYHEALAASPTRAQIAALLLIFGYALMGLAVATVLAYASGAPRRLRIVTGVLAFFGFTLMPGFVSVDFYDLAIATSLPTEQAVELSDKAQAYGLTAVAMVPALLGFILAPVLALTAAWRSGLVGAWAPAVAVAAFAFSAAVFGAAPIITAAALLLLAFAGVARGVLGQAASGSAGVVTFAGRENSSASSSIAPHRSSAMSRT